MPVIHQVRLDDILARLPELEPFNDQLKAGAEDCVLIAAAGFEDRARAILDLTRGQSWRDLCIINYPTNTVDNQPGLDAFGRLVGNKIECRIDYSRETFWQNLQRYFSRFDREGESLLVVMDISGMASYVIYPVLEAIRRTVPRAHLAVVYIEAEYYHPKKEEWDRFLDSISDINNALEVTERFQSCGSFESRGPNIVYTCPIYLGINPASLATQCVAIPSFGLERMKEMIAYADEQSNVGRDDIRWIFGNPPDRSKNGWRLDALMALYQASVASSSATVSTRNYKELVRVLEEIWEETLHHRHLVIATVGSKMQHLATYLFLCLHPNAALVLSEPQEFKAGQYSEGVGSAWWLDFGITGDVISNLQKVGKLEFRW